MFTTTTEENKKILPPVRLQKRFFHVEFFYPVPPVFYPVSRHVLPCSLSLLQQRLGRHDILRALTEDRLHAGQSGDLLPDLVRQLLKLLGRRRHLQSQNLVSQGLDNGCVCFLIWINTDQTKMNRFILRNVHKFLHIVKTRRRQEKLTHEKISNLPDEVAELLVALLHCLFALVGFDQHLQSVRFGFVCSDVRFPHLSRVPTQVQVTCLTSTCRCSTL